MVATPSNPVTCYPTTNVGMAELVDATDLKAEEAKTGPQPNVSVSNDLRRNTFPCRQFQSGRFKSV